LSMFRFFSRPSIDFMRIRYYWFTGTGILTVLGLALFIFRGELGLNIDFTGGTAVTARLQEPKDIAAVRAFFSTERQKDLLAVQAVRQTDEDARQFEVTYADGAKVPVQLQLKAVGATQAEREDYVKQKASELPNW